MAGEAILSFAGEIQKQVQADGHELSSLHLDEATSNKLDSYLSHLPVSTSTSYPSIRRRLDHAGTELWNSCTQRMTNCSEPTSSVVLCKVKAFAWAMLDTAISNRSLGSFRVLETAYKLVKTCIEHGCVAISLKVIEAVAMRLDALEHLETDVDKARLRQCNVHYYALRVQLAWLQGRPDIADHLFLKLPESITGDTCVLDLCFKVGSSALSCSQYDVAAKWLGRGLEQCKLLASSSEGSDVALQDKELLILHALVRANTHLDTHDSKDNLVRTLGHLKSQYSNMFSIRLLELEVLARENRDVERYFQVLQDALKVMDASESSFRMILYYTSKLQDSPDKYFQALKRLLIEMITNPCLQHELEHAFVRLVDVLTGPRFSAQASLRLFEEVADNPDFDKQLLSVEAQQACLMIVWKHINRAISDHDAPSAEKWCLFMLQQPVIPLSSDSRSKLLRKLILCASETLSTTAADTLFNQLPEECRHCPLTLYLMYKLTLRDSTCTSSSVYFQALFALAEVSSPYIISCIAEAFRQGKMIEALQCLQQLLSSKEGLQLDKQPGPLFQSTILYLVTELDACDATDEGLVDAITSAFKAALDMFPAQKQAGAFTTDELEWLAKKSYNLAMRQRNSERTEQTLSLLEVSIKFTTLHQEQVNPTNPPLNTTYLLCQFLKTTKHISLARQTIDPTKKKTHYTAAHESSIAFQANLTAHIQWPYNPESTPSPTSNLPQNAIPTVNASSDSDSNTLWLPKYRIILALDLEASIHLNSDDNTTSSSSNWTHITNLIHLSSPILTPQVTAIYLDILLRASTTTPLSNIVQAIKLLLRTIHTSPSPDLTKPTTTFHTTLPRYLHVLYQLALDASQPELAESVLDQVLVLVRDWKMTEFPEGEVQWMASVAFNRAVDFYLAGEDGECRRWAGKAIALADLLLLVVGGEDGGGALGRLLRARYGKLMVEGGLEGPGSMGS